jgi:hypothetical protein
MRDITIEVIGESLKNGVLHQPAGGEFNGQPTASTVL